MINPTNSNYVKGYGYGQSVAQVPTVKIEVNTPQIVSEHPFGNFQAYPPNYYTQHSNICNNSNNRVLEQNITNQDSKQSPSVDENTKTEDTQAQIIENVSLSSKDKEIGQIKDSAIENTETNTQNMNDSQLLKKQTKETEISQEKDLSTEMEGNSKVEKRTIVELTDEYIKTLEKYLNSSEQEIRIMGAKEVYERLNEDSSRFDNPALNALINKMLQDPTEEIKILAMTALEARIVSGNDFTIKILTQMQNSTDAYGNDAIDASRILLKMSQKPVEKNISLPENNGGNS